MYEAFYRLRALPFTLTPDPAFLYLSPQHKFALTLLRYGIVSQAGFCLLSGDVGSGKTMLVRKLLASLEQDVQVGLIANTGRHLGRLLPWICVAFGIDHTGRDEAAMYQLFVDYLVQQYAAGRRVVLIVDEAQNLGADSLEELRLLSNVNAGKHMVLQTFVVGQPELRDTLAMPQLRQFAQRISVDYHLAALGPADALGYVRHRLVVAGGDPELFTADAVEVAFGSSGGVPRLINQLCDMALVYGFADQQDRISAPLMRQVVADRVAGGIFRGGAPVANRVADGTAVMQLL